jgi:hypothetical protein
VPALLVDQELGGTGVSVLNGLGELDGVVQDGLTGLFSEMGGGGDLDDLHVVKEISMRKEKGINIAREQHRDPPSGVVAGRNNHAQTSERSCCSYPPRAGLRCA